MEILVSNIFLDQLSKFREDAFTSNDENKILLSVKLARFLNSNIDIATNITAEEVSRIFSNSKGNKEFRTIKESVIHKLVKNDYYYDEMNDISEIDCKSFLFTDNKCHSNVDNGMIELNFEKGKTEFYLDSTVTQRTFKNEYEDIRKYIPKCNCMLFVDPYIIEGNESDRKIKNENFIKLIQLFIKRDLNIKFQLTIITKIGQWNRMAKKLDIVPIQNIKDLVSKLDKLNNLEFEIYLVEKLYFGTDSQDRFRDRNYYTNYTKGSLGHPNDGKTTYFNQNFMAISADVNKDYDDYLKEIEIWRNFIKIIPKTIFGVKTKYGNLSGENRLFKSR
jgi:hypothetical protein